MKSICRIANSTRLSGIFRISILFFTALLGINFFTSTVVSQEFLSHEIIDSLARPVGIGRSNDTVFPSMERRDSDFVKTLPAVDLTFEQRNMLRILIMRSELPQIDLNVNFDFGSDKPTAGSLGLVNAIAQALQSPALSTSRILIAGHTDAVGSATANQHLSERRARAVRKILIETHKIQPNRLIAVGFGYERLKDTMDPTAGINRRVEIVNLGQL